MPGRLLGLFLLACALCACPETAQPPDFPSGPSPILLDGDFVDWESIRSLGIDPGGDVDRGEVDFVELRAVHDAHYLYLYLDAGRETVLHTPSPQIAGNDIRIEIGWRPEFALEPAATPAAAPEEYRLEIYLGQRRARLAGSDLLLDLRPNDLGLHAAPAYSSSRFELAVPLSLRVRQRPGLKLQGPLELSIRDGARGDRFPDAGVLVYSCTPLSPDPPSPIPLGKRDAADLRVLSHNVCFTGMAHRPAPFKRILRALQPDLVNFQEVWIWSGEQIEEFVTEALGGDWHMAKNDECVTLSRFPILHSAPLQNNLLVRIDLPGERELVLFNVHSPCCGNNAARDLAHDLIASSWRDLLEGQGPFPAEPDDAVIMLGDFNLMGFQHQLRSIRDGDILDNRRFGSDYAPARSRGSLAVTPLRHTHSNHVYTWRADPAPFVPTRFDYIFYSADAAVLKNNFSLWTPDMPEELLLEHGLLRGDSPEASDHLPVVADFEFPQ